MGSPRNEKTADLSPKDASTTWIPVLPSATLPENAQQIVDMLGMSVLLIRYRNTALARSLSLNASHSLARNPFDVQERGGWIWIRVKAAWTPQGT